MSYLKRFSACLVAQTNHNSSYCNFMQQSSRHKLITKQLIRKFPVHTIHLPSPRLSGTLYDYCDVN